MAMTDRVVQIPIDSIIVNRDSRQRKIIQTKDLEGSISKIGLIQPIVIDSEFILRAGERRLIACRNLGHKTILARFVEDLSEIEAQILELEENLKRQDLDWRDQANAVALIHNLYLQTDPDWTMADTAEAISLTTGTISMYIRVSRELAAGQDGEAMTPLASRVAEAGTVREAYNVISRKEARAQGDAIEELLGVATGLASPDESAAPIEEPILNENFLDWAPLYSGPKFNLIHCDFPFGVEFASGPQGQGAEPDYIYSDTADVYWELIRCLGRELNRLMAQSGHLMFWLSSSFTIHSRTRAMFAELCPSIEFQEKPLIWLKSDNAGISPDSRRMPRHVYETCLLGSRGGRQIARIVADAYAAPTDKRLHISTKPEPMLRHFMTMLVDDSTTLLDPTCGSGAALRAAESLGAKRILGLEIDPECCERAEQALRIERLKKKGYETLTQEAKA
jgi:ParB-like chromosome segregation protein Spo0J